MRALRLVLALACAMLMASPAFAQFPRIKLPKKPELPKKAPVSDPLEVSRKAAPTPEATASLERIVAGKPTEVVITLANAELGAVEAVDGFSNCKVLRWEAVPPNQLKLTIQGEGGAPDEPGEAANTKTFMNSGYCRGQVRLKPPPHALWSVRLLPDPNAAKAEAPQPAAKVPPPDPQAMARQAEYMQKLQGNEAEAPAKLGKQWQIEFSGGQKDTWNLLSVEGSRATFRTGSGQTVTVAYMMGRVVVQMTKDCGLMGTMAGGKITGQVMGRTCPWAMMSEWSALVK